MVIQLPSKLSIEISDHTSGHSLDIKVQHEDISVSQLPCRGSQESDAFIAEPGFSREHFGIVLQSSPISRFAASAKHKFWIPVNSFQDKLRPRHALKTSSGPPKTDDFEKLTAKRDTLCRSRPPEEDGG